MVFVDPNNNRRIDPNEPVITTLPPTPEGSRLVMRAALNKQYLRYMSTGMLENTAGSWVYCPANATEREARNVIFNRTGRMRFGTDHNRDGIPENKLHTVFERFYTERPQHEGYGHHSGLGLSISKQIVDAHGGQIWAENLRKDDGSIAGARFNVVLNKA